jgi:hypothetical protein
VTTNARAVFALAKRSAKMTPDEMELLLESPIHKARLGAVSVVDVQARRRTRTPQSRAASAMSST